MIVPRELCYASAAAVTALGGAVCDVHSRRIPNQWTGGGLLAGLALHLGLNGWQGLGNAVLAGLMAASGFLLLYIAGGMGAGDVKLMAAVGSLAGLASLETMLLTIVLAGAVMAIVLAIYHQRLQQTLRRAMELLAGRPIHISAWTGEPGAAESGAAESGLQMPFAVPIAFGCVCSMYVQFSR